jgi:hypothetical protein
MPGPLDKVTSGRDFNFFAKPSVTSNTFQNQADLIITFPTQTISFLLIGTGTVEYSFNGNTVHGDMDSTLSTRGLVFDNRLVSKIWFRLTSGGPVTIRVEAWGTYY